MPNDRESAAGQPHPGMMQNLPGEKMKAIREVLRIAKERAADQATAPSPEDSEANLEKLREVATEHINALIERMIKDGEIHLITIFTPEGAEQMGRSFTYHYTELSWGNEELKKHRPYTGDAAPSPNRLRGERLKIFINASPADKFKNGYGKISYEHPSHTDGRGFSTHLTITMPREQIEDIAALMEEQPELVFELYAVLAEKLGLLQGRQLAMTNDTSWLNYADMQRALEIKIPIPEQARNRTRAMANDFNAFYAAYFKNKENQK